MLDLIKAHAYGNDFLYVEHADLASPDWAGQARAVCDRHTGIGADGLIIFTRTPRGAAMRLVNADGSHAEVSGNGVRGLAALLARDRGLGPGGPADPATLVIESDAGDKVLTLLDVQGGRYVFRAAMGTPEAIAEVVLDVAGDPVRAVTLRVGNPQCVVLEPALDEARYRRLGPILERHAAFPAGTNVEFAVVEAADRVRILIWERGVGPTSASGTGACAAAVAAAAHGGASRDVEVVSPGGTQRVEWRPEGLFLTGWAEVIMEGRWTR